MATEVFNRTEKKYLIHQDIFDSFMGKLEQHLVPDAYHERKEYYTICNLYFDTDDNYYIRTSLEKPRYKEKLRLRGYGVPKADDEVYLEIKKKVSGVVNKRRSALTLQEANLFVSQGIRPCNGNHQVLREIDYILASRHLMPKLYLAYDRKAFYSRDCRGLRITFDRNIRTRRFDLCLESGDFGYPLLKEEYWLMEIKAEQGMPLFLTHLLAEHQIYPTGFSKYGAEYLRMTEYQNIQEGMQTCLKPFLKKVLAPLSQPQEQFLVS